MNLGHSPAIARLIQDFARLPGIGPKSAERLVYSLLRGQQTLLAQIADDLLRARDSVRPCAVCHCLTEDEPCAFCRDPRRERHLLCVVEDTVDLLAIERSGSYRGLYHVLGGLLSPLEGRGPEALNIESLLARVRGGEIREILLATNPNVEGEATAIYLQSLLPGSGVKTSRLACGVPQGGSLRFLDAATLSRAIAGRTDFKRDP